MNTLRLIKIFSVIALLGMSVVAQTTAFTYQGKLNDTGAPANGQYLLEFRLFDASSGGAQIGTTITDVNAAVTEGIFTCPPRFW